VEQSKQYFFKTFFALLLATASFLLFKTFLPKRILDEGSSLTENVVIDSLLLEAVADAEKEYIKDTLVNEKIDFKAIEGVKFPSETFEVYKGNQFLVSFFEKLFQLEKNPTKKVRIAYFGDSMTDGDMIVKDFRTYFQEKFGGEGVGFVSITSESASSRNSILHEFSPNWKTYSYLKTKHPVSPFGVNGHLFFTNDTLHDSWVKYKATKTRFASELGNPTLFYGKSKNTKGKIYQVSGIDTIYKKLKPTGKLNTLALSSNGQKTIKINFKKADSIPVYGFNFDNGKGVHIDNFSSRGNSGLPLSMFDIGLMRQFQEQLQYDLIILQYGTNVLNYGSHNYSWYEKRMNKAVAHLKECFPGVSILVISTADKSTKYDMQMKSDSAVVPLMLAQKKYAIQSQSAFVNLYTLMGGDGSMVSWVDEKPARASKDYTHFNFRGAKDVAKMIFSQINEGFEKYKKMRPVSKFSKKIFKKDSAKVVKDSMIYEE
jgi:lysophospholipase L1-like esterase